MKGIFALNQFLNGKKSVQLVVRAFTLKESGREIDIVFNKLLVISLCCSF